MPGLQAGLALDRGERDEEPLIAHLNGYGATKAGRTHGCSGYVGFLAHRRVPRFTEDDAHDGVLHLLTGKK